MFSGSILDLEEFQTRYWRRLGVALGQINIDQLTDLDSTRLYELAQLEEVESRVIASTTDGYDLTLGPFEAGGLGTGQMLMVQNLDSFVPEVSAWLSQSFGFLPRWRIEDVMATLANEGGNCGPHFDQYDVFLVQVRGTKHWSIDAGGHGAEDLDENAEIRLLSRFSAMEQILQQPGDVLYIPPGVGHHGIASDDSLTLSVGIRNPLLTEMASYLADLLLLTNADPMSLNDHLTGNQIEADEVAKLGQQLSGALTSPALISAWYGTYMTEPRDPELLAYDEVPEDLESWLAERDQLTLQLPARIAIQDSTLFINGESVQISEQPEWLIDLQQHREVQTTRVLPAHYAIVEALIHSGGVLA
tara:strand:- start:352 stop:1431 length:1080 start_codon:yes stop_codon:yes gene_type:complete